MHHIILCRSLTQAQRAQRALQRGGVFSSVTKAPQSANPGGCTYGVKVGARSTDRALALLREQGIETGAVYQMDARGEIREAAR